MIQTPEKKCKGCKENFQPRNGHQHYCETCRPIKLPTAGPGSLAGMLRQTIAQMVAEEVATAVPPAATAAAAELLRQVFGEVARR